MSADGDDSLTGQWQGQYSYPTIRQRTPFAAALVEMSGLLGGSITECSTRQATLGKPLYATLSGRRDAGRVSFTKTYEPGCEGYGVVAYEGALNADATEIEGHWSIGGYQGRFLMIRSGGKVASAARKIAVKA